MLIAISTELEGSDGNGIKANVMRSSKRIWPIKKRTQTPSLAEFLAARFPFVFMFNIVFLSCVTLQVGNLIYIIFDIKSGRISSILSFSTITVWTPQLRCKDRLFPGWRQAPDRRHASCEAYHLPVCSKTYEQDLWQGHVWGQPGWRYQENVVQHGV